MGGGKMTDSLPRYFRSTEEVRAAMGAPIGVSAYRKVTQSMVDRFAEITGDHEWLHIDPERAALGPFQGTVAHGYLTLSLVAGFAAELFRFDIGTATVNYGIERARFTAPLHTGSHVRAEASFTAVERNSAGHMITVRYVLDVEGSSKPVCIVDALLLAYSAPSTE